MPARYNHAHVPRLPKPFTVLKRGRVSLRFFHGDALEILGLLPKGSVDDVISGLYGTLISDKTAKQRRNALSQTLRVTLITRNTSYVSGSPFNETFNSFTKSI